MSKHPPVDWAIHYWHTPIHPCAQQQGDDGRYYRAICTPYPSTWRERLRAAWAVFTKQAYAIRWPEPGEFEQLLRSGQRDDT